MKDSDMGDLDALDLSLIARRHCEQLPRLCLAYIESNPAGDRIVGVRRGESGWFRTTLDDFSISVEHAKAVVDSMNEKLEVSWAQREAMIGGSIFGWYTPAADVTRYLRLADVAAAQAAH